MGLVGDDDDVAAVGEERVAVAAHIGQELLHGREDHAAGVDLEFGPQVGAALGLVGRLAEQLGAAGEGAEQLVVKVVTVGDDYYGGVLQRRVADDAPGVKGHGEALAGALGVPDHADATVAGCAAGMRPHTIGAGTGGGSPGGAELRISTLALLDSRGFNNLRIAIGAFVAYPERALKLIRPSP